MKLPNFSFSKPRIPSSWRLAGLGLALGLPVALGFGLPGGETTELFPVREFSTGEPAM